MKEEFEDTKGVIRIRISKKNRQHNNQKKKYKRTNSDLAKHTYKTKDRVTRTPLQTEGERSCPTPVIPKLIRTLIQDIGNHLTFL